MVQMSNSRLEAYNNFQWHQHLLKERKRQPGWLKLNYKDGGPCQSGLGDDETLACEAKTYIPGYAGHLRGIRAEALFGRTTNNHVDEASSFEPEFCTLGRGPHARRECEVVAKPFALPTINTKAGYAGHLGRNRPTEFMQAYNTVADQTRSRVPAPNAKGKIFDQGGARRRRSGGERRHGR